MAQIVLFPSPYLIYDCQGQNTSEALGLHFLFLFFSSERERNRGHWESVEGQRKTLLEVQALWEFVSQSAILLPISCELGWHSIPRKEKCVGRKHQ